MHDDRPGLRPARKARRSTCSRERIVVQNGWPWITSCKDRNRLRADNTTRFAPHEKDAMGRAARTMPPSSLQRINGAPHATAERFEQIPRNSRTRCNTDRRDRDGPVELAGRRYRAWHRALAVEEARG